MTINELGSSVERWPAFADTAAALRRLQTRYRLVVLSNVDRGPFALSSIRMGIEFDRVVPAQDVAEQHPDEVAPGLQIESSSRKTVFFSSMFSNTASITRSQSAKSCLSSEPLIRLMQRSTSFIDMRPFFAVRS